MKALFYPIHKIAIVLLFCFLLVACSGSNLKLAKNEKLPEIVKSHTSVTLMAKMPNMIDTGVMLEPGDLYTILATGTIDMSPGAGVWEIGPESGWLVFSRIGDGLAISPLAKGFNSETTTSTTGGNLYLGYRGLKGVDSKGTPWDPIGYGDDSGSLNFDVIVWKEEDYVQIYDFLEKMYKRNPNKAVRDALNYAETNKEYQIDRAQVVEKVRETKKMIADLSGSSTEIMANQGRIYELENKLSQLTTKVTQLDETKKQLEEERKKTAELAEALALQEARERELLGKLSAGVKAAPVIIVASPANGLETESKTVRLAGVTEDDTGIRQLNILINDKIVFPKNGRGIQVKNRKLPKRHHFNERINLDNGLNTISIRSMDTDGQVTEEIVSVTRIERRTNIWALVVGINEYQHVRNLKYAVNDARAFYNFLVNQNQVPKENVILLTNEQANLRNLRSAMGTQLKKMAGKEDLVIIFYAGHGATERDVASPDGDGLEKYLLPVDAELDDIYTSALPMREISHIFRRIRSERIIFIADSCYSGASGGRTVNVTGIRSGLSNTFLDRIAGSKGTVIITASGANEVSVESDEFKHGLFTYFILEGLKGKADIDGDSLITVDELYRYVSDNVARASGQEQHPVKKGMVEGQFVLGIVR